MKKVLSVLLCTVMLVSLSAVALSEAAPVELTFIFADGDEAFKTSMNRAVEGFNAANPNIVIKIQPGDGGTYSEFLKTKDSVGEFPDIMEMRDTAMYVRAGKLAPLSDEIVSLFKTTMQFGGKTYTTPYAGENTLGIIYNKAYFTEKGLAVPTTWDEFMALCQQIKDLGDMAPIVVGGQDIWHMGFWFHKIYSDNVLAVDPDFIKHCYEGTETFSDEKFVKTIQDLQALFAFAQDGWTSTPDAQITTFLVSDMAAMMYSGTHMFTQIAQADPEFEMGWFPAPNREGTLRLVGGAGIGGFSISTEAAADPAKLAAFEAFLRYFYEKDNYKQFLETMSYLPVTVDTPEVAGTDVYLAVIDAVNNADFLSPMWNGFQGENELPPDFRNFTYKTIVEVIQGSRTVESACEELQKTWDVYAASFNPVTGVGIQ
jgi:raffinose/stachyose/melibiose transport system substrate-binding protein